MVPVIGNSRHAGVAIARQHLPNVSTWNAKVGRSSWAVVRGLRELVRDQDPDVVLLCEVVPRYLRAIRLAFPRWRIYAKRGWPESRQCPVMERRSMGKRLRYGKGWGTVRMAEPWAGPQGGRHDGRTWTWIRRGGRLMSTHRAWTGPGGKNQRAHMEEAWTMARWLEAGGPAAALGDQNVRPGDRRAGSSQDIAKVTGGRVLYDRRDPRIDHAVAVGLDGSVEHGPKYGSDHHSTRYKLLYR